MAGFLEPDFNPALNEMRRLALDVNFSEALDHFSKRGLPLFVIEVNSLCTETTGNLVYTYKLSNQLHIDLAAMRTGQLKPEAIRVERCVGHVDPPCPLIEEP